MNQHQAHGPSFVSPHEEAAAESDEAASATSPTFPTTRTNSAPGASDAASGRGPPRAAPASSTAATDVSRRSSSRAHRSSNLLSKVRHALGKRGGGGPNKKASSSGSSSTAASAPASSSSAASHAASSGEAQRARSDPYGEEIARILGRHPAWNSSGPVTSLARRGDADADAASLLSFRLPLMSRHNANVLRELVVRLFSGRRIQASTQACPLTRREDRTTAARRPPGTTFLGRLIRLARDIYPTLRFFFTCLAFLTLFSVGALHAVAVLATDYVVVGMLVGLGTSIVLDVNDVPPCLHRWTRRIQQGLTWVDRHLLWGKRWEKREWNRDGINLSGGEVRDDGDGPIQQGDADHRMTSRGYWPVALTLPPSPPPPDTSMVKSLWELPPPDIKQGRRLCLSQKHLAEAHRDEWSPETVKHRLAVNYCYVMIREDHLRAQAERHRRLQNRMKKPQEHLQLPDKPNMENGVVRHNNDDLQQVRGSDSDVGLGLGLGPSPSSSHADDRRDSAAATAPSDALGRKARSGSSGRTSDRPDRGAENVPEAPQHEASSHNKGGNKDRGDSRGGSDSCSGVGGAGTTLEEWVRTNRRPGSPDCVSEQESSVASDCGDMPWIDVTAQIGMRLLSSAHVHRAMTDPTFKSKLVLAGNEHDHPIIDDPDGESHAAHPHSADAPRATQAVDPSHNRAAAPALKVTKPVHSMWTSPSAAAAAAAASALAMESPRSADPHEFGASDEPGSGTGRTVDHPHGSFHGLPAGRRQKLPAPQQQQAQASDNIEVQLQAPLSLYEAEMRRPAVPQPGRAASPTDTMISSQTITVRSKSTNQRQPLLPGVKVAVPMYPIRPRPLFTSATRKSRGVKAPPCFQMGTVVRSQRIYVETQDGESHRLPNCLSVTVKLDRSFLRNAEFAELTFRVMDEWTSSRYMPRHSKVPIGSCVATTFGIGVVVGWRVHDDCHVVRSLWHRRGQGSAHAYLQASAIHSVVEAAVGFEVNTKYGWGTTRAYVDGGPTFESGRFVVELREEGRRHPRVVHVSRKDVFSCLGAQFMPVIEHIREAARYKIQMDNYEAALREQRYDDSQETDDARLWKDWSSCLDILWGSFLKAVDEDSAFDEGVNEFMTSIIDFLERLDAADPDVAGNDPTHKLAASDFEVECYMSGDDPFSKPKEKEDPGLWVINDIFGGIFRPHQDEEPDPVPKQEIKGEESRKPSHYDRIFAVLRTIMKTVSFAKAESVDHPHFRLALAISHDFLLFVRTIVKVQQKNSSTHSLDVWKRAFGEIALTFGPMKDRLEKIGRGIAHRMEKHGRRAKTRVLRFVDTVLGDEKLLFAMEQGEWDQCLSRLEIALVKSKIVQEKSLFYYRKTGQFIYEHVKASISTGGGAASRNNEKLALLAQALRSIASPLRSLLKVFVHPSVLDLFERILVRVYCREEHASRILSIHASNFHSLRHLRMLKDFSVAGKIWIPLLNAADEEFSDVVTQLPENSKEFMCPLSNLFSLCVAQFHKINEGDLSKDWLDFLLEDDAVQIIDEIDMKLILVLEQFSRDVREMMEVLPYYPSIDDDILKLMDEVNLDEFLKEASAAIDDQETLSQFFREKVTIAIERFLNYLPRMSIPVERRELGDGWVLTCRGEDGSDLTLTDVKVKRENLVCQIMGGDTLFFPMFGEGEGSETGFLEASSSPAPTLCDTAISHEEESILDHIRSLLLQAQSYGCWKPGVGGVGEPPTDRYVASVLHGLPVSTVLNCSIELWRNLEIDDDELLEIAIRDVSFQIQLQKAREEGVGGDASSTSSVGSSITPPPTKGPAWSVGSMRPRFNPRLDPTVLFLEMKNLTLNLDNFTFRIEKNKKRTILDPVFDGRCMVSLQNINIRLRVECGKERAKRAHPGGSESCAPILRIQELVVGLENLQLRVKDTGFGSDWLLNRAVHVFGDNITRVVEENLRDQILEQCRSAVEHLNGYFLVNPNLLLNLLGVSIDDLEEHVVFV